MILRKTPSPNCLSSEADGGNTTIALCPDWLTVSTRSARDYPFTVVTFYHDRSAVSLERGVGCGKSVGIVCGSWAVTVEVRTRYHGL